ncbi:MAG: hypothetical protein PF495_20345 [Spirochaetales bacterium]|jgi:hypothetical protein|nr:hypothetical protein [Spirochaetales bacterium]
MIRTAQFKDVPDIISFMKPTIEHSSRSGKIDETVLLNSVESALSLPYMCAFVEEKDGVICGVVSGVVSPSFFSKSLIATDVFFASTSGNGAFLYRRFIKWAKSFNSVEQICFTNSFGDDRVDKIINRLGFKQVGGYHTMEIEQ